MLMLQAFTDDSGSDKQGPVYVLSGYLGKVDDWAAFSDAWQIKLHQHPRIEYFKMSEAESLKEQFENWDEAARDHKVLELTKLIPPKVISNIECIVAQSDYDSEIGRILSVIKKSRNLEDKKLAKCLADPYFFCFYGLVVNCIQHMKELGRYEVVEFYFDEQGQLGKRAMSLWDVHRRYIPAPYAAYIPHPPVFRDEKLWMPLQAADLIAWQTRRRIDEKQRGIQEMRPALRLLRQIPFWSNRWNAARLRKFITDYHLDRI